MCAAGLCGERCSALLFDVSMHPLEVLYLRRIRRRLIAQAAGRVLEVGCGTGVNLPFFGWQRIEQLTLVDLEFPPSLRDYAFPHTVDVQFQRQSVEQLEFADNSFDAVVFSLVFCSVADNRRGMAELHRVLAPGGRMFFIEHVLPPSRLLRAPMRALNPLWRRLNSGCNLTRDTVRLIEQTGFVLEELERSARGVLVSGIARKPHANLRE